MGNTISTVLGKGAVVRLAGPGFAKATFAKSVAVSKVAAINTSAIAGSALLQGTGIKAIAAVSAMSVLGPPVGFALLFTGMVYLVQSRRPLAASRWHRPHRG